MAKEYLEKLNRLMDKLKVECPENTSLELKHFFSGAAAYINNRIFLTLTPAGLALKVSEEMKTLLVSKYGAKPLQYFAKAPVKRDYALFQDITTLDSRDLKTWIKSSAEYALSFPKKISKKKKD